MVINDEEENNFISYGLAVRFQKFLEKIISIFFEKFFFEIFLRTKKMKKSLAKNEAMDWAF